jgi:choice-of-anchor B domain-containing protein
MLKLMIGLSLLTSIAYAQFEVSTSPSVQKIGHLDLKRSGLSARKGNDIWGWTDPSTGKEYAIMGLDSKTSFIDISNPANPIHIADIKTATRSSTWRDMKIYKNYAYIVSEAYRHGMQVVNLEQLRNYNGSVMTLRADVHYKKFGNAHNIAINEETGYAYAVGTSTCDGGLHIINIQNPTKPKFVNCIGRGVYELPQNQKHGDAYTHDVQCVVYKGADSRFIGHEICVSSNEDTVNVVDVTDKSKPYQISVSSYAAVKYTHQGWLTEDHNFFLLGDELDESNFGVNTKTFIWDFRDLENIKQFAVYEAKTKSIDHNMYVKGNYVYQANYEAGLRILNVEQVEQGILTEVGFMDTMPNSDRAKFNGVWSVFPYFKSGIIAVSGINGVLYLAKANLP